MFKILLSERHRVLHTTDFDVELHTAIVRKNLISFCSPFIRLGNPWCISRPGSSKKVVTCHFFDTDSVSDRQETN